MSWRIAGIEVFRPPRTTRNTVIIVIIVIVVLYLFQKDFLFGNLLEADYHYTTIFGQSHSLRRFYYLCRKAIYDIGTKILFLQ